MPKFEVLLDRDYICSLLTTITVEAEDKDDAWDKAMDMVDFGNLRVRDCTYSYDQINQIE